MATPASTSPSSTLWAIPSKEWVIQPKPKPGRKPKKDSLAQCNGKIDEHGRRVQNRAAQRAFRERKQSQLADLQARVQSYEQGEVERNIALQSISKRLKEENEALRKENDSLKERVSQLESRILDAEKKRWREFSPPSSTSQRKKSKIDRESPRELTPTIPATYLPSPPSMMHSPDTGPGDAQFPGISFENHHESLQASLSSLLNIPKTAPQPHRGPAFPTFSCGFCTESTACMCRELSTTASTSAIIDQVKLDDFSTAATRSLVIDMDSNSPGDSILDNLPAYQPPVPLRRRATGLSSANTVFPVMPQPAPASMDASSSPTCSGDPQNCLACADDSFGKAFCTAIEEVAGQSRCIGCPCSVQHTLGQGCSTGCCQSEAPHQNEPGQSIPTNRAWQQIKSHPNASFADLALLADVVVRRSKCAGPRVEISPPPSSVTTEQITTSPTAGSYIDPNHGQIDAHGQFGEQEGEQKRGSTSPPRLVPEEILVRCGRRRVREVHTDAVRDALRILDAKLPQS